MDNTRIFLTCGDTEVEFDFLDKVTLEDGSEYLVLVDIQNDYVQILPFGGVSGKDTADQPLDEGTIDKVFELFCARNRDLFELDE